MLSSAHGWILSITVNPNDSFEKSFDDETLFLEKVWKKLVSELVLRKKEISLLQIERESEVSALNTEKCDLQDRLNKTLNEVAIA